MIAFIIHDAVSSGDKVMFAESFEAWWANLLKEGKAVFQKTGEIDGNGEFGRVYRFDWAEEDEETPKDFAAFKELCKNNGWRLTEPEYVEAKTINENLVLRFGG